MQALSKGDSAQAMLSLLASIDSHLEKLVYLSELGFGKSSSLETIFAQAQAAGAKVRFAEPEKPQVDPSRIPTFEPKEKDIMRDSAGQPEIVRFPLPNAHGTVIYKKHAGPPAPGGFTISVQGPDGLVRKYEEVARNE